MSLIGCRRGLVFGEGSKHRSVRITRDPEIQRIRRQTKAATPENSATLTQVMERAW
jgi:hypothetical protein